MKDQEQNERLAKELMSSATRMKMFLIKADMMIERDPVKQNELLKLYFEVNLTLDKAMN